MIELKAEPSSLGTISKEITSQKTKPIYLIRLAFFKTKNRILSPIFCYLASNLFLVLKFFVKFFTLINIGLYFVYSFLYLCLLVIKFPTFYPQWSD